MSNLITVILPLAAAIWLFLIIRRNGRMNPIEGHTHDVLRVVLYVAGFWVSFLFATYIGFYLYASGSGFLSVVGLFVSGMLGALIPYRMRAREGNDSVIGWLVTALVYTILFYAVTWMFS